MKLTRVLIDELSKRGDNMINENVNLVSTDLEKTPKVIKNKLQSSSSSHPMITIRVFFDGPTSSSKSTSLSLLFSSTPISFNIISLYFGFCTH